MPNWCSNSLIIHGDDKKLDELESAANKGELLSTIVPIGVWEYGKAINAWGTKWDIAEPGVTREEGTLYLNFDSAWAPPTVAYEALIEQEGVESVSATYFEPGMDFAGSWDNGMDDYIENVSEIVRSNPSHWPPGFKELDEEYDFTSWYEVEPDELVEFLEEGAKAREEAE
jgi:hypothetical protein